MGRDLRETGIRLRGPGLGIACAMAWLGLGEPVVHAESPSESHVEAMMEGKATMAGGPDHAAHQTVVVAILSSGLSPTIQVVENGDAFGWLNYSASNARIRFQGSIVDKIFCRSPGQFNISADRLEAPEVPSGAYATLCSLKPGEYDYEVHLTGQGRPLLGKIVVPKS